MSQMPKWPIIRPLSQKTLYAPFSGKLGISQIQLVSSLPRKAYRVPSVVEPYLCAFFFAAAECARHGRALRYGDVRCLPGDGFEGKISAMNPDIDPLTRTVRVQATLKNENEQLRPGMFVSVKIDLGRQEQRLVIPTNGCAVQPTGFGLHQKKPVRKKEARRH